MDLKSKAESIVSSFFETKKNSNSLLELEELLLDCKDEESLPAILSIVSETFSKIFSSGLLSLSLSSDKQRDYKLWLLNRYDDFTSHIFPYFSHEKSEIQVAALEAIMMFVQMESQYGYRTQENPAFPIPLFKRVISALASDILDQCDVIKAFEKYSTYDDVKLYLLKSIEALLRDQVPSDICLRNCFSLLCSISFPTSFNDSHTLGSHSEGQSFQLKEKPFRKLFSYVWNCFLNHQLSPSLLPKVLTALNENVLPYLLNPCLLTDFLTSAYEGGGVLSLLALKGLFILMGKYNLEYPDFFVKLYALLDPCIINGKYSPRFFHLCNLFLSSTHLPVHIVAAFAKKFARLSLVSNANNILKIIALITNLLTSHPSLELLLHRIDAQESSEDSFNIHEENPARSYALKSCLWEIKTLEAHVHPDVCYKAKELMARSPKSTLDATKISNMSLYDLYIKHRKRKFSEVPLAVYKPSMKRTKT